MHLFKELKEKTREFYEVETLKGIKCRFWREKALKAFSKLIFFKESLM